MKHALATFFATALLSIQSASAGQAPGAASDPDIPISHRDRVYSAEQYSNTVSLTDPASNTLVGAIRLGDPLPANLSPLYRGQLLVHGMGFSPDHRTIAVVAIGSNAVNFIDTAVLPPSSGRIAPATKLAPAAPYFVLSYARWMDGLPPIRPGAAPE